MKLNKRHRLIIFLVVFMTLFTSIGTTVANAQAYTKTIKTIIADKTYGEDLKDSLKEYNKNAPKTGDWIIDGVVLLFYDIPLILGISLNHFLRNWGMTPDAIIYGNATPEDEKTGDMAKLESTTQGVLNPNMLKNDVLKDIFLENVAIFYYMAGGVFLIAFLMHLLITLIAKSKLIQYRTRENFQKWILAFILFFIIYSLMWYLLSVNNDLVNIFKPSEEEGLMGLFNEQKTENFVGALNYLIINILSIWLFVVYSLRAVYILFISIMILVAIFKLSFGKTDMLGMLIKEYVGNVFINTIHAFVFLKVAEICVYPDINPLIKFLAVASIIPLTAMLQAWTGLKSYGGAGKALAGIGMFAGAMYIGRQVMGNVRKNANEVKEGATGLITANTKGILENKGYSESNEERAKKHAEDIKTSGSNGLRNNVGNIENLDDIRRQSRKKMIRGATGLLTGAATSVVGAGVGYALGGGKGAFMGAAVTQSMGSSIGRGIAGATDTAIESSIYFGRDILGETEFGENLGVKTNEERIEEKLGFKGTPLEGTDYAEQIKTATLKSEAWRVLGFNSIADNIYARNMPEQKDLNEIIKNGETFYEYQDNDKRVFFTGEKDENGNLQIKEIVKVDYNGGNSSLSEPIIMQWKKSDNGQPVKTMLPADIMKENIERGRIEADKVINLQEAKNRHKQLTEEYEKTIKINTIKDTVASNIKFVEQGNLDNIDFQIENINYDNLNNALNHFKDGEYDKGNTSLGTDLREIARNVNFKLNTEYEGYQDMGSNEREEIFMEHFNSELENHISNNLDSFDLKDISVVKNIQQEALSLANQEIDLQQLQIDHTNIARNITNQLNQQYLSIIERHKSIDTQNAHLINRYTAPKTGEINIDSITNEIDKLNQLFSEKITTTVDSIN